MQHRTLRFAGATFVSAALVSTSLSAAAVAGTRHHKSDVLDVTVCKEVKDNNHDRWQKRKGHKDDKFEFKAWTDKETEHFTLKDGDCEDLSLDFDNNKFWLKETEDRGFDVRFKVWGDDEDTSTDGNTCLLYTSPSPRDS